MTPAPPEPNPDDLGDFAIDPRLFGGTPKATPPVADTNGEILQQMRSMELRIKELSEALQQKPATNATARLRSPKTPVPTPQKSPSASLERSEKFPPRNPQGGAVELGRKREPLPPRLILPTLLLDEPLPPLPIVPEETKRKKRRSTSTSGTLTPRRSRWLPVLSILMLLLALAATGFVARQFFFHRHPALLHPVANNAIDWDTRKTRAERHVANFLRIPTVPERAPLVRDSARVLPIMRDWYNRHPSDLQPPQIDVITSTVEKYPNPKLPNPYIQVKVERKDAPPLLIPVEFIKDQPLIEWESFVGYSAIPLGLLPSQSPKPQDPSLTLRVHAQLADPASLTDPQAPLHLRFSDTDPETPDIRGTWPADGAGSADIRNAFRNARPGTPLPFILQAKPKEDYLISGEIALQSILLGWRWIEP